MNSDKLEDLVNQLLPVTMIEAGCPRRLAEKRKLQAKAKALIVDWHHWQNRNPSTNDPGRETKDLASV